MPRANARSGAGGKGGGGEGRPRRARSQSQRSKHGNPKPLPPLTSDSIVSLTPAGQRFVKQLLEAASAEAGRQVTNFDMLEVMRRVREELGTRDVNFKIPEHMECMIKHLRAIGKEPPAPPPPGFMTK